MGLLGKSKGKSVNFTFFVHVHSLAPWPVGQKLVVQWERGSKSGSTAAVAPKTRPGESWSSYIWEETIQIPCTLFQGPYKAPSGEQHTIFFKKFLVLNIVEPGRAAAKAKEPLGRVVVDLAEFAVENIQEQHSFEVAATPEAHLVGSPRMLVTVACRGKNARPDPLHFQNMAQHAGLAHADSFTDDSETNYDRYGRDVDYERGSEAMQTPTASSSVADSGRGGPEDVAAAAAALAQMEDSDDDSLMAEPTSLKMAASQRAAQSKLPQPGAAIMATAATSAAIATAAGRALRPEQQQNRYDEDGILIDSDEDDNFQAALATAAAAQELQRASEVAHAPVTAPAAAPWPDRRSPAAFPASPARSSAASAAASPARSLPPTASSPGQASPQVGEGPHLRHVAVPEHVLMPDRGFGARDAAAAAVEVVDPRPAALGYVEPASPGTARSVPSGPGENGTGHRRGGSFGSASFGSQGSLEFIQDGATVEAPLGGVAPSLGSRGRLQSNNSWAAWHESIMANQPKRMYDRSDSTREVARDPAAAATAPATKFVRRPSAIERSPQPGVGRSLRGASVLEDRDEEGEELGEEELEAESPRSAIRSLNRSNASGSPAGSAQQQSGDDGHAGGSPRQNGEEVDSFGSWARSGGADTPDSARRRGITRKDTGYFLPSSASGRSVPNDVEPELAEVDEAELIDAAFASPRAPEPDIAPVKLSPAKLRKPSAASSLNSISEEDATAAEEGAEVATPAPAAAPLPSISIGTPASGAGAALMASPTALASAEGVSAAQVEGMMKELRAMAAVEASVFLARSFKKGRARGSERAGIHAPARRLGRTIISLGPEEGIAFGLRSIGTIQAAVDSAGEDVVGLAYWWSNCIQLRWMLWAMCRGADTPDSPTAASQDEFDWVMTVLVPPLRELETYIFEAMFQFLWWKILIQGISREPLVVPLSEAFGIVVPLSDAFTSAEFGGGGGKRGASKPQKVSPQEVAVQRWLDALTAVHQRLVPTESSTGGAHVALLVQKVLSSVLRRLDTVLFNMLVDAQSAAGAEAFSPGCRDRSQRPFDATLASTQLDDRVLPFQRGPLTCGTGVNLKMALTRWTNWAASVGLKEEQRATAEGSSLFPKLRASADLLMMPKSLLTDRAYRSEVVPGLSLRRIIGLMERFQPDDFAPEPLPRGLLSILRSQIPLSEEDAAPEQAEAPRYEPPEERLLLERNLIEPASLEMDEDSEDELEAMVNMYDYEKNGDGLYRFTLLKELWASSR